MEIISKLNSKIYIPYNAKMVIISKTDSLYKIFYIYIDGKKFVFLSNNLFIINKWENSLTFVKNFKSLNQIKLNNEFDAFFRSLNCYFFKKIKFKGKGFRIKFFKKIKLIKFYFGRSHKTFMFLKKIKRKKINKYKFILYSIIRQKTLNVSIKITKIKKINFYTLRGIRLSRQIIFKRKGKKGTYI